MSERPRRVRLMLVIAAAVMAALMALQWWQIAGQRRIEACQAAGGRWNATRGECVPGVILQRDIYRL